MYTTPWSMLGGGLVGLVLGFMFKLRLLPFLRGETILSGGKQVPTAQFAAYGAQWFFIGGAALVATSLLWLAVRTLGRK